ncbi:MAG: phage terminase large subunit [Nitrospina sp.]|nr:phage terminase large subunit [Nitrospina sp.]
MKEKLSTMHEEMYLRYQLQIINSESSGKGGKEALAAPRGNAKSTLSTLILPLWCIAGEKKKFIVIISDTTEQAEEFLDGIKSELEANERLREDFPEACGSGRTWKKTKLITENGISVRCWGKRKRLRGARHGNRRPDLVICDDLEDDENIDSPEQREKDRKWFFKAVMKVGGRYTVYVVIGTILHYDSLLARLLKRPGWNGKKWKAIISWSSSQLWEKWESIYTSRTLDADDKAEKYFFRHQKEMLRGTRVLWPEAESYYYLMTMRVSDGPAYFDSEKQNEPVNPEDCLFQEEWFRFMPEPVGIQKETKFYCAIDPSMGGSSRKADPSAIIVGALQPDGIIDIIQADIQKRHPDAIMETLFVYHQQYRFERIAIEEVQFQQLFKDHVIKEGAKRKLYPPIEGVRPINDKTLRISKLQPHIKNGLIRFRRNQNVFLEQLKYFPKASHDDGPDALEMLFNLINSGFNEPRIRRVI